MSSFYSYELIMVIRHSYDVYSQLPKGLQGMLQHQVVVFSNQVKAGVTPLTLATSQGR